MGPRRFDPRRLDVAALGSARQCLDGQWPLSAFERLSPDILPPAPADVVPWSATGQMHAGPDGRSQPKLLLQARATVGMACQRCLQPLTVDLQVHSRFRFVADEAEAERLDADSDDDLLVATGALDLFPLLEDELILALPLCPRHGRCEADLADAAAARAGEAHPFAALVALQRGRDDKRRR